MKEFGIEKSAAREIEGSPEDLERGEKMKAFIEKAAEKLQEEGVPVDSECRIDMTAFKGVLPPNTIANDLDIVKRWVKEWHPELSPQEREEKKLASTGEQMEMLKTAILSKFIGEDFLVLRTSAYDDIKNGVDNVILEKESGNLVCAVDDVGERKKFKEKRDQILGRNVKEGGGVLKYGLNLKKGNEPVKERLVKEKRYHIPLFLFALPEAVVKEGVDKFVPSFEEKSENDKKVFTSFITLTREQIKDLQEQRNLDETLAERVNRFEKSLSKFERYTEK